MRALLRTGILIVSGTILAGCASTRPDLPLDTNLVSAPELIRRVSENTAGIVTLTGSGSVSFESPELAGSVFFTVTMRKPDSMLIRFEGPFGLDAGFLFLSRARYVMYNRMENRVISGVPSDAGIRWGIPLDLTVDQILDAFTGTFTFPHTMPPAQYVIDGDHFRLTYNHSSGAESFWVDPATSLVTRYEKSGTPFGVVAETSLPEKQENHRIPRQITLVFPESGRRLSVYYSSLTVNPGHVSFAHGIPRSATSP